jgi:hypothetical protein
VAVLEANSQACVGRFGWESQHTSLVSFAADADLNKRGLTSPLSLDENLADGQFVGFGSGYDPMPEPEDNGEATLRPSCARPKRPANHSQHFCRNLTGS